MTAIFALWCKDGRDPREDGARMLGALRPHGIDHQALWSDGPVAMGRTLYRTLPEDAHDHQPIRLCGGAHHLIADVRLDNRVELASTLGLPAGQCATLSDSGLLGLAWERWGRTCLSHIVGDFAFIVWDAPNRRLFAARDHTGMRPLVYCTGRDFFAVASMPKGLLALPFVPRALDIEKLARTVAVSEMERRPYDTRSFYAGISLLPARHALTATHDGLALDRYWEIEPQPTLRLACDEDYIEGLSELLDRAIQARLRSAGPVASELSGGLDSGAVTVIASRLLAARGQRLAAFTAVPRDGAAAVAPFGRMADEGPAAASVAATLGNVDHLRLPYPLASPLPLLDATIVAAERPIAVLSYLPIIDQIARAARARGARVVLDGAMGNFTMTYDGFERLPILLWQGKWGAWRREVAALARRGRGRSWLTAARQIAEAMPPAVRDALLTRFATRSHWQTPALGAPFRARHTGRDAARALMFRPGDQRHPSALWARRLSDATAHGEAFVAAGTLALHGIDYRSPARDKRLIDFCMGLPLDQLFRDGQPRMLIRRLMQHAMPAEVLLQRRRGYQGAGWLDNLRLAQDEIRALFANMRGSEAGLALLDLDRLERLAASIPASGEDDAAIVVDYKNTLSNGIAVARFIRHVEHRDD